MKRSLRTLSALVSKEEWVNLKDCLKSLGAMQHYNFWTDITDNIAGSALKAALICFFAMSLDYDNDYNNSAVPDNFFDDSFLTIDLECSLSYADLNVSDSILNTDTVLPLPSTSAGGSRVNFRDVLQGLQSFTQNISEETCKGNSNITEEKNGLKKTGKIKNKNVIRKGQRYNPSFKQKVLKYAVKHTFKDTADKYNINCNTLTEWAREYKRLLQLKKSTTSKPGLKCKTEVSNNLANNNETDDLSQRLSCDANFIAWLRSKRLNGIKVGRDQVQSAAFQFLHSNPDCPPWFASWLNRLSKNSASNVPVTNDSEKHIFYSRSFKVEVSLFAKEYTKLVAAETFGLSTRRLYEWSETVEAGNFRESNTNCSITQTKQQVESQLQLWFNQQQTAGVRPKSSELAAKARELYAANGLPHLKCSQGWLEKIQKRLNLKFCHVDDEPLLLWILSKLDDNQSLSVQQVTSKSRELALQSGVSSFKGSKGWTLRFLKRHSHVLQCTSARLCNLPAVAAEKARAFSDYLQNKISDSNISTENIGCMDEVPITFVFPTDKVQTPRLLRKVGLEEAHAVVILAATSNGLLLPPAVVFKGKNPMQTFQSEGTSILVFYHPNGSVEKSILKDWCQHIWFRYVDSPNALVVDSFAPHQNQEFHDWLVSEGCHPAVIPSGCAVHLQPCSLSLSNSFQEVVREKWLEHTNQTSCPEWKTKTIPDDMMILKWVVSAYLMLREDSYSIRSSFHLTGLIRSSPCGHQLTNP